MERWMAGVDKRVLDFWEAYDKIEPLPDPWFQSASICEQIDHLIASHSAQVGVKHKVRTYEDFMPYRWDGPKSKSVPVPSSGGMGMNALRSRIEQRLDK